MGTFAIVDNGIVVNTIIAENLETAESISGQTCVESTQENTAIIGLGCENGIFEQLPYEEPVFTVLSPGDEGYMEPYTEPN